MRIPSPRLLAVVSLAFVPGIVACGDDWNPTGGGGPSSDTSPPKVVRITAVDDHHVTVLFNEQVTSAEYPYNYEIAEAGSLRLPGAQPAPGDQIHVAAAVLQDDQRTVVLSTTSTMGFRLYTISIQNVEDVDGNRIRKAVSRQFTGSADPDLTAPELVGRYPESGATGLPLSTFVDMHFSEPIDNDSFFKGVTWSKDGGGELDVSKGGGSDGYTLFHHDPLELGTAYTVSLHGIEDLQGNIMPDTQWSFVTMTSSDHTRPTLVSTSPANLSSNVAAHTTISLTFSEPMNERNLEVLFRPWPTSLGLGWSADSTTLLIDPGATLQPNQHYEVSILDNGMYDVAGNGIAGFNSLVFTTGPTLENGSIAGVVTGHPGTLAADPAGAVVMAGTQSYDPLGLASVGSTDVKEDGAYSIDHLPDGGYYLLALLDTNHDGHLYLWRGDAIGAYGVDNWPAAHQASEVVINGGHDATMINFSMVDPSALTGKVAYAGPVTNWTVYVGLFNTENFNPSDTPVATTSNQFSYEYWHLLSINEGFPDGNYYLGAFIDANLNGKYDAASDPVGFYGGIGSPASLSLVNGADFNDVVIPIADPSPGMAAVSVTWPKPRHNAVLSRFKELLKDRSVRGGSGSFEQSSLNNQSR